MIPIPKLLGSVFAMSFFTIMLLMSIFAGQVQLVYAGGAGNLTSGTITPSGAIFLGSFYQDGDRAFFEV